MTAGSSAATGDSRQLNSSQSAVPSQQRQLSSSQSATASSGTTSQQQPTQQQPVHNRELSHNQSTKAAQQQQVTTTTSVNHLFGPALQLNVGAEGVCQIQPTKQLVPAWSCRTKSLRPAAAPPPSWVPSLAIPIGGGGGVGTASTQRRE